MKQVVPHVTTSSGWSLRPWRGDATDIETVLLASTDPQIRLFSSAGLVRDRSDAVAWIESRQTADRLDWVIEISGEIVGRVGLASIDRDNQDAEFGYWLLPQARGTGVATNAVRRLTDWAFTDGGLSRLEIKHVPRNVKSCAVAERCGFPAEGLQRGGHFQQGQRQDLHVHARLATDLG